MLFRSRAAAAHSLNERMKEMSERIETMDQISQNMDREFKSSRVVSPMHLIDELFFSFLYELIDSRT